MKSKKIRNLVLKLLAGTLLTSAVIGNCSFAMADNTMKKATAPINITVGKGERFDFQTIQEAVDSIKVEPTNVNKATISINPGVYEEVVVVAKPYVVFKNGGNNPKADDVIITYDRACGHIDSSKNFGTQKTATVTVDEGAIGFSAENVTFQNSYNLDNSDGRAQVQAVALVSLADKVSFNNCRFIGRQDTLFLKGASKGQDVYGDVNTARVYLNNCYIEGTVDYIFGDATAYFENCKLHIVKTDSTNHFTASNTTLFNLGYVFNNCVLTADEEYTEADKAKLDLGRPWQSEAKYENYGSQSVFLNCKLPSILNEGLFTLWNDETVENKIRYYYYNLTDEANKPYNTSKANSFAKELTEEQAAAYSVSNVLRGDDGWNPADVNIKGESRVCDVTLNKYVLDIPKDEKFQLKAIVLPNYADNKNVSFTSENEEIAKVSENGEIVALKEGSTKVYATTEDNGFSAYAVINVIAPRTLPPVVDNMSLSKSENISSGDTLTLNYSYKLKSDKEIDAADIRWFAVNPTNDDEILLKEGNWETGLTYKVNDSDIGYKIKAVVTPKSATSYGDEGERESVISNDAVKEGLNGSAKTYLKEGFAQFYETKYQDKSTDTYPTQKDYSSKWIGTNSANKVAFSVLNQNGTTAIVPETEELNDSSLLEYNAYEKEEKWTNGNYEFRLRFNPEIKGLNAEAYIDFYTDYNGKNNSYYKLRFVRGGNTNSLKAYLYKKAGSNSEEILLASDESSLANKVAQNSGENNPWFRVTQTNNNGNINVALSLDNESTKLLNMTATDNEAIGGGFVAFECYGRTNAVVLSSITVTGAKNKVDDSDKIRVYLAGDSTVKSYGDDNTIGGWGEFLPYYFDSDKVEIINKAEGGRSSRSYLNQGRLDEILNEIRPGDYLFIQFGHNDARTTEDARVEHSVALGEPDANGIYPTNQAIKVQTPPRIKEFYQNTDYPYSDTFYPYESGTFKWYMKQYVDKAREKGAIPILVTPVARVFFDENGKITAHHGENDGYVSAVIQVANETNCNFVNMFDITKTMYENYGVKVTQGLQNIKTDGSMDITHYNKFGSNIVTSLLVKALADQNLPLANYTIESSRFVSKTEDLKDATVFVLGDETAGEAGENDEYKVNPVGWQGYFSKYFVSQIKVKNLALSGASSKSYIESKEYKEFLSSVKEGDYVLIQFGLNDSLTDNSNDLIDKHTTTGKDKEAEGSFQYYLYNYYLKPVIEKKAVAVLVTPISTMNSDELKAYSDDIRALAGDTMTAFINLYDDSAALYNKLDETSKESLQAVYKNGSVDEKHLNDYGARYMAKNIIDMVKFSSATLKSYVSDANYNAESNDQITKGEFIVALMGELGINGEPATNFNDVVKGKSYYDAIGNAAELGVINADAEGNFYPEDYIDRNTAIEAVKKALAKTETTQELDIDELFGEEENVTRTLAYKIMAIINGILK